MATELLRVTSGISLRTNPTTFLRGPRQGRCVYIPSRNSVRRWSIGGVLFLVLSRHILFSFPTAIELPTYLPTLFIPDPPLYTRRQFTFFFWGYAREKYAMIFGVALTWSGKKKKRIITWVPIYQPTYLSRYLHNYKYTSRAYLVMKFWGQWRSISSSTLAGSAGLLPGPSVVFTIVGNVLCRWPSGWIMSMLTDEKPLAGHLYIITLSRRREIQDRAGRDIRLCVSCSCPLELPIRRR